MQPWEAGGWAARGALTARGTVWVGGSCKERWCLLGGTVSPARPPRTAFLREPEAAALLCWTSGKHRPILTGPTAVP